MRPRRARCRCPLPDAPRPSALCARGSDRALSQFESADKRVGDARRCPGLRQAGWGEEVDGGIGREQEREGRSPSSTVATPKSRTPCSTQSGAIERHAVPVGIGLDDGHDARSPAAETARSRAMLWASAAASTSAQARAGGESAVTGRTRAAGLRRMRLARPGGGRSGSRCGGRRPEQAGPGRARSGPCGHTRRSYWSVCDPGLARVAPL